MRFAVVVGAVVILVSACSTQEPATARGTASPTHVANPTPPPTPTPSATPTPTVQVDTTASYALTPPGATQANGGSISGLVDCPCDGIPAQDVYAISSDGARFYATQTVPWQTHWKILGVSAGQYYVYAAARVERAEGATYDSAPRKFAAGYTVAIACGLSVSCTDHSPVAVTVRPGSDTGNVETLDWYSTDFPLVPTAGPAAPVVKFPPGSFPTAADAAAYQGVEATDAPQAAGPADCPVNLACFWLVSSRTGTGAAYYTAIAGSNGLNVSCGLYLTSVGSSWEIFEGFCRAAGVFPAVGAAGVVRLFPGETGCINVYVSPSLSAGVVACLADGTAVRIDDGPVYTGNGSGYEGTAYWWHLAGKGWMVHQNLLGA